MNIKVYEKNGVVYLTHIETKPPKIIKKSFVYNPVHRDTEYLAQFLQGDGQVWQRRMGLVLGSLQKGTVPSPVDSGCTNVPGNPGPKCPPTK